MEQEKIEQEKIDLGEDRQVSKEAVFIALFEMLAYDFIRKSEKGVLTLRDSEMKELEKFMLERDIEFYGGELKNEEGEMEKAVFIRTLYQGKVNKDE